MKGFRNFQHVTVAVGDIGRSLAFYRDLLGFPHLGRLSYRAKGLLIDFLDIGGDMILELFSSRGGSRPSHALPDNRQLGLRHIGFKVRDTDATAARLRDAGVRFLLDPCVGTGGARLAFFLDPDGTELEIMDAPVRYHRLISERDRPYVQAPSTGLAFDHVTITVSSLDAAMAFYRDILGFKVLGQLYKDARHDFVITYLEAGGAVLELFSFSGATIPNPWDPDESALGLKHLGFHVDDVDIAAAGLRREDVRFIYEPADALGNVKTAFFADPDGNALELIDGVPGFDR